MAEETGLLTTLGDSADWLKDKEDISLRTRRLTAVEAYRTAWSDPAGEDTLKSLKVALVHLIETLRANHLYPDQASLERDEGKRRVILPEPKTLSEDFARLKHFCVVNKHGIGEIPLMYSLFLVFRALCGGGEMPHIITTVEGIGDVVLLRAPVDHVDNTAPFSSELAARYHAVRLVCGMKELGCLDEPPSDKLSSEKRAGIADLFLASTRAAAAPYIPERLRPAFEFLGASFALEEQADTPPEIGVLRDPQPAEKLFRRLVKYLKQFKASPAREKSRNQQLLKLGVAALVKAMPCVEPSLGVRMYNFLRNGRHIATIHHSQMFRLLRRRSERLRFLNFLYANGKLQPRYFIRKFQRHFGKRKLRFRNEEVGFELEPRPDKKGPSRPGHSPADEEDANGSSNETELED